MKQLLAGLVLVGVVRVALPAAGHEGPRAAALEANGGGAKQGKGKRLSDAQIRQILIDESIAAYSGNCPCPYNRASNGSRCGRRSAYSREGGAAPLCYPKDVTKQMVEEYRAAHAEQ